MPFNIIFSEGCANAALSNPPPASIIHKTVVIAALTATIRNIISLVLPNVCFPSKAEYRAAKTNTADTIHIGVSESIYNPIASLKSLIFIPEYTIMLIPDKIYTAL